MIKKILFTLCIIIGIGGCAKQPVSYKSIEMSQPRKQLTFEQLQGHSTTLFVDMKYFKKPEWGVNATHNFSGSLSFKETLMSTTIKYSTWVGIGQTQFPAFTIDFVSDGNALIPRQEGIISTYREGYSFWDVIVGVGKIWKEPGDKNWDRASFPLTLVSRRVGQAKNCVGTFIYNDKDISHTYVQCSQETSPIDAYQIGDMQVTLSTEYEPKEFEDSTKVIKAYYDSIKYRMPIYSLNKIDPSNKIATLFQDDTWTSLGCVVIDQRIYLQPPMTRHGIYPYPNEMRHGVFSVTKSLSGSLAMFYLAERYSEGIFDEFIVDYIPVLADHPGWQDVTFSHVLNMVTGVEGKDKGEYIVPFIYARGMDVGIKVISNLKDLPERPGEKFNYASTNSFVLSYAMQKYVEKKEGKGIYYWDLIHENVLKIIKAESFVLQHTEESDGSKGIPIIGWGAYPTVDETAKIATLFLNEGRYENQQLLNKIKVQEALYRTAWEGYDASENRKYNHSFWSRNISIGGCSKRVSYMCGHGGNYVMFLPDNAILIWYIDKMDYAIDPVVRAVGKTITWCD